MNGDWVGYVAAALTTFSFVPQAVRTIRTKETHGISLWMYVMFNVGIAFWLVYGLVLMSWPMILANIVTLALSGTILALKIRYG
jgi:MtN3 and saliva related transmembrane protein